MGKRVDTWTVTRSHNALALARGRRNEERVCLLSVQHGAELEHDRVPIAELEVQSELAERANERRARDCPQRQQ